MFTLGFLFFRLSILIYTLYLLTLGIDYIDTCLTYCKLERTAFKRDLYTVGYTVIQLMFFTMWILIITYAAFDMFHTFFDLIGGTL